MTPSDRLANLDDLPTPAGLEQFQVSFPDGRAMARIGLRMSFFFRRVAAPETRRVLISIAQEYVGMAGPRMRTWKLAKDRAWRKLAEVDILAALKDGDSYGATRKQARA